MIQRTNRCRDQPRQAQKGTTADQDTYQSQIEVVGGSLLKLVIGAIDDSRGDVLVQED